MSHQRGVLLGIGAYVIWGLTPLFWNLVANVAAVEVLAHRILWAVPILIAVLAARRRLTGLAGVYASRRRLALAAIAGALIAVNWGVYIWAVTNDHIVEASLGYFINPLVSVALGVVVLREHLRPAQRIAVAIAAVGVAGMTILLGVLPWISLALAFSFGFYGLLKKHEAAAPPAEGLLGEVVFLAVPAGLFLALGGTGAFARSVPTALWFVAAGALTVVPLTMFGASAQRIPLSVVGLLQYIAPTLQLLIGLVVFGEHLAGGQILGFVAVWLALAVFARDQVVMTRALRPASEPSRSSG